MQKTEVSVVRLHQLMVYILWKLNINMKYKILILTLGIVLGFAGTVYFLIFIA
jgi:hypothetical protein